MWNRRSLLYAVVVAVALLVFVRVAPVRTNPSTPVPGLDAAQQERQSNPAMRPSDGRIRSSADPTLYADDTPPNSSGRPRSSIDGTVVDSRSIPTAGAQIVVRLHAATDYFIIHHYEVVSTSHGTFDVQIPAAELADAGLICAFASLGRLVSRSVCLDRGDLESSDIDLVLLGGGTVEGQMLGTDQNWLNWRVSAIPEGSREPWTARVATISDDGRFSFPTLIAGEYRLIAHHPATSEAASTSVTVHEDTRIVTTLEFTGPPLDRCVGVRIDGDSRESAVFGVYQIGERRAERVSQGRYLVLPESESGTLVEIRIELTDRDVRHVRDFEPGQTVLVRTAAVEDMELEIMNLFGYARAD